MLGHFLIAARLECFPLKTASKLSLYVSFNNMKGGREIKGKAGKVNSTKAYVRNDGSLYKEEIVMLRKGT
jgi:hypothetical protein